MLLGLGQYIVFKVVVWLPDRELAVVSADGMVRTPFFFVGFLKITCLPRLAVQRSFAPSLEQSLESA